MTAMHLTLLLTRFTPSEPDLDQAIGDLEELWASQGPRVPVPAEEWPVDKAARICPVFRFITGNKPAWLYDPAEFPGFTQEQIEAGLTVPACLADEGKAPR